MDKQSRLARTILNGFIAYFAEFENITLSSRTRFENAEWRATQEASMRRIDIYKLQVLETLDVVEYIVSTIMTFDPLACNWAGCVAVMCGESTRCQFQ